MPPPVIIDAIYVNRYILNYNCGEINNIRKKGTSVPHYLSDLSGNASVRMTAALFQSAELIIVSISR